MSYRDALIVTIALLFSLPACAKDGNVTPILSDLWLSKSIGVWEKGKQYGYFKVLVYRTGLEHASDKVKVMITQADTKNNRQKISHEQWLNSPGYNGFVESVSLKILKPDKLILGIDIQMKGMDGVVMKEVYIIDSKGKMKQVVNVKYKDIY